MRTRIPATKCPSCEPRDSATQCFHTWHGTRFARATFCALFILGIALVPRDARAGLLITIEQVGTDVVTAGSGTLDLTGTTLAGPGAGRVAGINGFFTSIILGPTTPTIPDIYFGLTGPSFGTGLGLLATSGSGDLFGIGTPTAASGSFVVPRGYQSGSPLSATDIYANQTLSSPRLGLIPGTYQYSLPSDTITVQIGPAVPEPSTAVLAVIGGVCGLAYVLVRKRRSERRQGAAGQPQTTE